MARRSFGKNLLVGTLGCVGVVSSSLSSSGVGNALSGNAWLALCLGSAMFGSSVCWPFGTCVVASEFFDYMKYRNYNEEKIAEMKIKAEADKELANASAFDYS